MEICRVETGLLFNAVIAMERINVEFHNFVWQLLQVAFSIIFEKHYLQNNIWHK